MTETAQAAGIGLSDEKPRTMLIALPCMSTVPMEFMMSLVHMRPACPSKIVYTQNTLIHDARNELSARAITQGFDRILFIDSDMRFDSDLAKRMDDVMTEHGLDYLCGLYFTRVLPIKPTLYVHMAEVTTKDGRSIETDTLLDYPKDQLFEIDASGFGAVMIRTEVLKQAWEKFGPPFNPYMNLGEDLSFCWRLKQMGVRMWCDSSIKLGHVGMCTFGENLYNIDAVRGQQVDTMSSDLMRKRHQQNTTTSEQQKGEPTA